MPDGSRSRRIIAIGGGWLGDDPALDDLILSYVPNGRPRIGFLGTASGESDAYTLSFYKAFTAEKCEPSHLSLFGRDVQTVGDRIARQDIIFVGGGNTANMLAIWRVHRVDAALTDAYRKGVILAGTSAGANCWFECSVTDSFGPLQPLPDGLGLLAGSICPHYDSEPERRPTYHRLIREGFPSGFALEDGTAAIFTDEGFDEAVTSRPGGRALRVSLRDHDVNEEVLRTRLLTE